MGVIMVVEIAQSDKGEVVRPQTKVKIEADVHAVETPPKSHVEFSMRWQRRPAAMLTFVPPRHPRRPPLTVRQPDPATTVMQVPAPIMEWRPTPRIIRRPEPTRVGEDPMTAVAIGLPGMVDDHHPRLPTPADTLKLHPAP